MSIKSIPVVHAYMQKIALIDEVSHHTLELHTITVPSSETKCGSKRCLLFPWFSRTTQVFSEALEGCLFLVYNTIQILIQYFPKYYQCPIYTITYHSAYIYVIIYIGVRDPMHEMFNGHLTPANNPFKPSSVGHSIWG